MQKWSSRPYSAIFFLHIISPMFRRLKFEILSHPGQNEKSYETSIFYPLEAAGGLYWPRRSVSCLGLKKGCLEVSEMVRHLVFH